MMVTAILWSTCSVLGIICTLFHLIPAAVLQSRGDHLFFFWQIKKELARLEGLFRDSQQVTGSGFGSSHHPACSETQE